MVVAAKQARRFQKLAALENLEATVIARVSARKRLQMKWRGRTIVDLGRDFLDSNGAGRQAGVEVACPDPGGDFFRVRPAAGELQNAWASVLADVNVASQKGLVERFDSSIGAATVLSPFGGKFQTTPADAMVAKIPLLKGETHSGTIMAFGFNPDLSGWSPFHGGVYAVIEAVARISGLWR